MKQFHWTIQQVTTELVFGAALSSCWLELQRLCLQGKSKRMRDLIVTVSRRNVFNFCFV